MATSRLSKEAESKITNSLSEIAELVNSGVGPNEAIAKTASANGIPVGQVELMVRAFNVGRSEAQRLSGPEAHEKLAEFDLADPRAVMEIMFPSSVKSASAIKKDTSVSELYSKAPVKAAASLPPLPPLMPMLKAASASPAKVGDVKDDYGYNRAMGSMLEKISSSAAKLSMDSAKSRDKVMEGINKLANYFRSFGGRPFMVVKDNSERLFGKKAEALLNILMASNRHLKKQAGTVKDSAAAVDLSEEPYRSIKGCIDLAKVHLNKQAASKFLSNLVEHSSSVEKESTGSVLDGLNKEAWVNPTTKSLFSSLFAPVGNRFGQSATGSDLNFSGLSDARFEADQLIQNAKIRNIRASASLADLMANDEVISSHHPEDISFHFNEISKIMPESSTNTAIMRPLLRKRLEGGTAAIDPFDVTQMLEMEAYKRMDKDPSYHERTIRPLKDKSKGKDKDKGKI